MSSSYNATIMNCYSTGSVNGSGSAVGGLVGRMYNQSGGKSEIINSYCLSSSLDLVGVKEYSTSTAVRAIIGNEFQRVVCSKYEETSKF